MKDKKRVIIIIAAVLIFTAGVTTGIVMHIHNKAPADKTTSSESDNTENMEDPSEIAPTFERSLISDDTLKSEKTELVEATDSDFEILGTDFNDMDSFLSIIFNTFYNEDYDSQKYSTKDVIGKIVSHMGGCGFYFLYFDEDNLTEYEENPDPLKRFDVEVLDVPTPYYYSYSVEKMNWIIKNIFNVEPELVTDFNTCGYTDPLPYHYDGRYYFIGHDGGDGAEWVRMKEGSQKRLNDGTYSIVVESGYTDNTVNSSYANVIVGLKEINGQKFWSLYKLEWVFDDEP